MTEPTLHVTFTASGAGSLRTAVETAGRQDEVIGSIDDLSFGPIDYPNIQAREAWIERELGYAAFSSVLEETETFWKKVLADKRRKVLWMSQRSAMEYTGFLECLWRLGDTPCSVVDLTDTVIKCRKRDGTLGQPELAVCLGGLLPERDILENNLLDQAEPLTQEKREYYHALWKRIRAENAPFRVVSAEGIASAPITYFDELVRSCVITRFQKSARVIGDVFGRQLKDKYFQVGDLVLFSRLRKLVEMGVLESQGDMSQMLYSEVRLPSSPLSQVELQQMIEKANYWALGCLYESGQGVPKDYAEAMKWFQKGADQREIWSQLALGRFYANGYGVKQDLEQACFWLCLFDRNSDNKLPLAATYVRDEIAKNLTGKRIAELSQRAEEWKPNKQEI